VGNWPLVWKEMYRGDSESGALEFEREVWTDWKLLLPVALLGLIALAVVAAGIESGMQRELRAAAFLEPVVAVLAASGWCAVLSFRAAAGICRERDAGTLDSLLTLPVSRGELLGAKWLGAVFHGRGFGYLLAIALAVGIAARWLHPLGALLLATALAVHFAFLASVGVWLSVASRTPTQARVLVGVVLLVFLGGGLVQMASHNWSAVKLQPGLVSRQPEIPWRDLAAEVGASAPGAWRFLSFSEEEFVQRGDDGTIFSARLTVALWGIGTYGLLAGGLYFLAYRRFLKA
jgi:hypothetical protein